jgi:hypothetical protein
MAEPAHPYGEPPATISATIKRELEFKLDTKISNEDMVKIASESFNLSSLTYAEKT